MEAVAHLAVDLEAIKFITSGGKEKIDWNKRAMRRKVQERNLIVSSTGFGGQIIWSKTRETPSRDLEERKERFKNFVNMAAELYTRGQCLPDWFEAVDLRGGK